MKAMMIASIGIILLITQTVMQVYATHYYTGNRWSSYSIDVCYDSYSLKNIVLDDKGDQYSKVAQQLDIARNDWNRLQSIFTLNKKDTCDNWAYATYRGDEFIAQTMLCINWIGSCYYDSQNMPSGNIVKASITFNADDKWSTSRQCASPYNKVGPWALNYVARHEFGHWVAFRHTSENSVMYHSYNCNYRDSIKPHDSYSLTIIYG
ncbi:MAG: matrixin family metalloprotease [Candidatus Nitrosocaldaceae archaeon]